MKMEREIYATIFIRKWGSFIIIKDKKNQKHRKPMKLTLLDGTLKYIETHTS